MNTFSVGSTIRAAWQTFKKRPWLFVGAIVCVAIVSLVGNLAAAVFGNQGLGGIAGALVNFLVSILVGMGEAALFLKAQRDPASANIVDLWHPRPFWKYIGAAVLTGVAVLLAVAAVIIVTALLNLVISGGATVFLDVVSLIVLVVVAIMIAVRFQFAQYIVIDRGLSPIAAVRESIRITRAHFLALLGLFFVLILINIVGAICLLVGLLVSVPVTMLAVVHAYRTLSGGTPAQVL